MFAPLLDCNVEEPASGNFASGAGLGNPCHSAESAKHSSLGPSPLLAAQCFGLLTSPRLINQARPAAVIVGGNMPEGKREADEQRLHAFRTRQL